ncbi:MAG: amino acid adenylation domain-containing protein [Rhodocyclaceae bacterium]
MSERERHTMLYEWNDTAAALPYLTFLELFHAQVARAPFALAVASEAQAMTYAELNERAHAWAGVLIREQVAPGELVAIALTRDADMLVALLGTLMAGAAYLPLDPDFPMERLRSIVEDACPRLLLSCRTVIDRLPRTSIPTLLMDDPGQAQLLQVRVPRPAEPVAQADGPAYVIYTSGSTGRPKGVEVPHKALVNFLYAMQHALKLTPEDKILAVTTLSFDIAALELFLPITVGASVFIAERTTVRDPGALSELVVAEGITMLQATPSLWKALVPEYAASLKGVRPLVGGEALPGQLAGALSSLGRTVVNLYGPTETTVWSTIMPLEDPRDMQSPPIGRPILNTQVYVLDHAMEPVPVGVTGDLYIAGDGVALGYFQRPDLTRERFVANPFGEEGSRVYKTGDKARWRDDGVLEYQGRADHQVKIRGFRIEIGDVEAALLVCPEVRHAIVVAQTAPTGEKQLVAYVVTADCSLDVVALRRRLVETLPDYMVPAYYMTLAAMPLTPNGKVDRKALPLPAWHASSRYAPPRNRLEEMLVNLWAESLGRPHVGIHDNFFEIGGDSISATRILNTIRKTLSVEVPLGVLFKASTISDLSEYLSGSEDWDPLISPLPIRPSGDDPPLFCIHPALGLAWGYAGLLRHLSSSTPLIGLQAKGLREGVRLPSSVEELADAYLEQVKYVQPHGPYRLLGGSFGGLVAHAMAEKLQKSGECVDFLCMLDSYPYQLDYQATASDSEIISAVLQFLGYELAQLERLPETREALAEMLWKDYDDSSMSVVKDIQRVHPEIMDRVQVVIENNLAMASRFKPGVVDADLLFFVAAESVEASMGCILESHPDAWRTRITGEIEIHYVQCRHQDMTDPAPLDVIGPIVNERLQGLAQSRSARASQSSTPPEVGAVIK